MSLICSQQTINSQNVVQEYGRPPYSPIIDKTQIKNLTNYLTTATQSTVGTYLGHGVTPIKVKQFIGNGKILFQKSIGQLAVYLRDEKSITMVYSNKDPVFYKGKSEIHTFTLSSSHPKNIQDTFKNIDNQISQGKVTSMYGRESYSSIKDSKRIKSLVTYLKKVSGQDIGNYLGHGFTVNRVEQYVASGDIFFNTHKGRLKTYLTGEKSIMMFYDNAGDALHIGKKILPLTLTESIPESIRKIFKGVD